VLGTPGLALLQSHLRRDRIVRRGDAPVLPLQQSGRGQCFPHPHARAGHRVAIGSPVP
jgi:hypothetical protein